MIALFAYAFLLPLRAQAQLARSEAHAGPSPPVDIVATARPALHEGFAVQGKPASAFWFGVGVGAGTLPSEGSVFAASLSLTYQRRGHLFSTRAAFAGDLAFGPYLFDVGVLYGRAFSVGRRVASMAAGVSVVDGDSDSFCFAVGYASSCAGNSREAFGATLGVPLAVHLHSLRTGFFDVGLYGFANLNRTGTFGGVLLHARLGDLR
jgi:hypothetical protein